MKKTIVSVLSISSLAITLLSMGSCTTDPDSSGYEYMPDMYRSPAIEAYVDYAEIRGMEFKSKKEMLSAMTPPRNTVPYIGTDSTEVKLMLPNIRKANISFRETHGLFGYDYSMLDEYTLAAADNFNPIILTPENSEKVLAKGKELFTAMCQHCHGEKGDGNGPMVASGAYSGVPNYANLTNLSNGQIYYSIYYGKGMMGAHHLLLNKKEIWTLVHYVRQFQISGYGKFDETGTSMAIATSTDTTAVKTK